MKANEAPEKIYRTTTYLDNDKGKTLWKEAPVKGAENIEYTRTDDFIDKAANYLNYILYDRVEIKKPETIIPSLCVKGEFIEDFRNYMKGE